MSSDEELFDNESKNRKRARKKQFNARRFLDDKADEEDESDSGKQQKRGKGEQHEKYDQKFLARKTKTLNLSDLQKQAEYNDELDRQRQEEREARRKHRIEEGEPHEESYSDVYSDEEMD